MPNARSPAGCAALLPPPLTTAASTDTTTAAAATPLFACALISPTPCRKSLWHKLLIGTGRRLDGRGESVCQYPVSEIVRSVIDSGNFPMVVAVPLSRLTL